MSTEFCIEHGYEFMQYDRPLIAYCAVCDKVAEVCAAKDARIAELEAAYAAICDSNTAWRHIIARVGEAEKLLAASKDKLALAELALATRDTAFEAETARAEQAESQLTEAKARALYANGVADLAMKHRDRTEAEADSLRATIDNMRAMNIKLTFEATGKVLAAEAEVTKKHLELCEYQTQLDATSTALERAEAALEPFSNIYVGEMNDDDIIAVKVKHVRKACGGVDGDTGRN